ncbi:MAG TPA: hypothetical protein PLR60_03015 [Syntrophorhabdaceae bacterium]|nr:hypothetical protein [Syntrophorhabdaceae bacterium]
MIIEEITDLMETFCDESLKKITIERIVIGVYFTGIKLSNGSCCFIHNIKGQGALKGGTVYDILRLPPASPLTRTIKIVALNALSPFPVSDSKYYVVHDAGALFRRGVDAVGGIVVTGADRTLDMLTEWTGTHRLFNACVCKINILNKKPKRSRNKICFRHSSMI